MNNITEFDALSVESDEESSGALIHRIFTVKCPRNVKENDNHETLKIEAEADEVPSLNSNVEVAENTAESGKDNCSGREGTTRIMKEADPSERTCVEETICRANEEILKLGGSSGNFLCMISSNGAAVTTMPTNGTEPFKTQPKVISEWSLVKEEGSESSTLLDNGGEVIDYENKDTELVKEEKLIQTMTVNENHPSVSSTIMQNSQDGLMRAQDEMQLSNHWSRTLRNSTSTGKVEEVVRVLKEQQSHDLLCPICGSCITKRLILRKRKRISTDSVDRWIQEPDDDAQAALLEGRQQITGDENGQPEILCEDSNETEAYGCLACFSIFFRRVVGVQHLFTKGENVKESFEDQDPTSVLQDTREISDKEKDSFYCLPFQNPWRKHSKKEPRPGKQLKEPLLVEPENETLDDKVSRALKECSSYGMFQSDKDVTSSQQLATTKEFRRRLSHQAKDNHGVATRSISYQTSITTAKTLTVLGNKKTKYTLTEATDMAKDVNGSDESSKLKEKFPPAKGSEDQQTELHLDDSARVHAKHKKQEHVKSETPDGDVSIILPDVLPRNIETSLQETVGSEKTNYTLSEAANITQYVDGSGKSTQLKEPFPPAKRSEDRLAELYLDDERLHTTREEQERHAKNEMLDVGASIILPDVLSGNIGINIQKEGIREEQATYGQGSNNISSVLRDEELQQGTAAQEDESYKTDYMCNCIPVSIQRVWSIWPLKERITDQPLKEPLLLKETLEENVSAVPAKSGSHGILQSDELLIRSQPRDDTENEATSPLLSSRIKSSSLLTKQVPTPLHSEKIAISTDVTVPPIQTVIEVGPIDDSPPSDVATTVPELARASTAQPQVRKIVTEWDILKSIVYGGLTVSLTSLGVVSSAAGGEAKTLMVITIGLTNLVAGLFVILNNMLDLDHYHKDHFVDRIGHSLWFNGSVAIVSYLIFGSLAPITYAFSFQKSDDRLYKFIATSAVSLVCIILLALGRARVSKKSYVRTVILYIVTGFWSAVAGFLAGEYIKKLLEKWGIKTE